MKVKKIIIITILIIIIMPIFCFVMEHYFPAEWSFITPHKQGDFVRVGNKHYPSCGRRMILLNDDRVFMYSAEKIEIYNPKTRRFKKINSKVLSGGLYPDAIKLKDGNILILGGCEYGHITPHTYIFNSKTNKLSKGADMLACRRDYSAALLEDGRVFISGGSRYNGQKAKKTYSWLSSTELYNPDTNTFEQGPDLKQPRTEHYSVLLNGKVFLLSGYGELIDPYNAPIISEVESYNPKTNSIENAGKLTFERFGTDILITQNDEIFILEGLYQSTPYGHDHIKVIEKYDPKTNISTIVNKRTSSPEFISTALLSDDTILFYGGSTGFSIGYTSHSNAQIYNPKTNKFTDVKSKIPVNLYEGSSSVILKDGNLLITGGGRGDLKYAVIYMTKNKIER